MLRTEKVEPDGALLLLARSVVHPDAPEKKGITRSELDIGGWVIKSCGTHSSVVIYVNQSNLDASFLTRNGRPAKAAISREKTHIEGTNKSS